MIGGKFDFLEKVIYIIFDKISTKQDCEAHHKLGYCVSYRFYFFEMKDKYGHVVRY